MKDLRKLCMFVHAIGKDRLSSGCITLTVGDDFYTNWKRILEKESQDSGTALCAVGPIQEELQDCCAQCFGDRVFSLLQENEDHSDETKVLIADDLEKTLRQRGSIQEWIPEEMAVSRQARRLAEGLKKEMKQRGYSFNPETIEIESWGNVWSGCSMTFPMFLARYLGASRPVRRNVEISTRTDWPMQTNRFVNGYRMDHNVGLFLFIGANGLPIAQYVDGLRAVWEKPHIAVVPIDPDKVRVHTISPCSFSRLNEAAKVLEDRVVADVGDGCHPAFTTLVGTGMELPEFESAVAKAQILDRDDNCRMYIGWSSYPLRYHFP